MWLNLWQLLHPKGLDIASGRLSVTFRSAILFKVAELYFALISATSKKRVSILIPFLDNFPQTSVKDLGR